MDYSLDLVTRLGALLGVALSLAGGSLWLDWWSWRERRRQAARDRLGRLHRLPLGAGMSRRNPGYEGFMRALELR